MAITAEKPAYMEFLEAKGIFARGYFRFSKSPQTGYSVTRSFQLLGLDGERAELDENDLWERYEELEPLTRGEFDVLRQRALDKLYASRGQPSQQMAENLAHRFVEEYDLHWEDGRWQTICKYDEETIRRIIGQASMLLAGKKATAAQQQKKADRLFRDVVLAKVQRHLKG